MKDELMKLSQDKGFLSIDRLVSVHDVYYYRWMCELQQWLRKEHNIITSVEYTCISSDEYEYGYKIMYEKGEGKRQCERIKIIESIDFYPGGYTNNAFPANCSSYEEVLEQGLLKSLTLL